MNYGAVKANFFEMLTFKSVQAFIIPGAIVTIIYASFMWSMGWLSPDPYIDPEVLSWSSKLMYWLTSGAKWFSTMLFEFVVLTLFSPIMSMLSEHVDNIFTEDEPNFSVTRFVRDLLRTLGILITGFIFSSLIIVIWYLFAWIGDLSVITPYIIFVLKAFFIGFSFFDYCLERDQISIVKSWRYAINRPITMLSIGGIFSLIFAIPILGVMLAPYLLTVLTAVMYHHEKFPSPKRQSFPN
jgi:CysZ protein